MIEIRVDDMTCGHCASMVTKAVKTTDGSAKVEIDLPARCVRVDSSLDREEFVAAIQEAGYTPQA